MARGSRRGARSARGSSGARGSRGARLAVDRAGDVVTLTLEADDAPPSLTSDLHATLVERAAEIDLDESVRAVVLRARGADFCAGASEAAEPGSDGIEAIGRLRVPVLALLRGAVLDEGLELALACDLRLAASGARLGMTQLKRGTLPCHGGTQRLPRVVGRARALRMLLLGEILSAREAEAAGLITRVVSRDGLGTAGARLARDLAARAPIAQRFAKEALHAALDVPLLEGMRLEGDLYVLLQTTRDRDEGIESARAKRRARFLGK